MTIAYFLVFGLLLGFLPEIADSQAQCGSYKYSRFCGSSGPAYAPVPRDCVEERCHGEGLFHCTCPGNGQHVNYKIACTRRNKACHATNGGKNCDKFRNCASCRSGYGEWDGGCLSCLPGYQLVSGWCHNDINECNYGKCEQLCTNNYGSYRCSCRPGFRLRSDRHKCERLSCADPGGISGGSVVKRNSFLFEDYVQYSCNFPLVLVGNSVRRCTAVLQWTGIQPKCVDVSCSSEGRQCGPKSVTSDQCLQLGCCYENSTACHLRQDRPYLLFRGVTPSVKAQYTLTEYTTDGCNYMCANTPWCKSFGIARTHTDQVVHQLCHLYHQTRHEFLSNKKMASAEEKIDFVQPLKSDGSHAAENLARGRPTWQSSLYAAYTPSSKAVDGNRDPNWSQRSCACSLVNEVNPWWVVDLGRQANVGKVMFYNRQDCCAERANDFIIGLTDKSPAVQRPTVGKYALCGQHVGPVGAVGTVTCSARSPPARFVIVQLNRIDTLTICELEVYERDVDECATNNGGCAQKCTNTPGSYLCSCNSGFKLNANGRSCDGDNLKMLYVGCFDDNSGEMKLFNYQVWSSELSTIDRCIVSCRQQSYTIAVLRNGSECYCDNDDSSLFNINSSSKCDTPCAGRSDQTCGGTISNSVYRVPADDHYVGCYNDKADDQDFNTLVWSKPGNHSASECIGRCLKDGFKYAALQNGSRCYCGNSYGRHGNVHFDNCREKCTTKAHESCGGPSTNAVYDTELGVFLRSDTLKLGSIRKMYHSDSSRLIKIPLALFTEHNSGASITTQRFVLRVTESILTPSEQDACSPNCYKDCGDVSPYDTEGLEYRGQDQIVRFFHVDLADLVKYVGKDAQRVFVYAQTVFVKANLVFPFSLQVYTRQLVLDRHNARYIQVSSTSPTLDVDFKEPTTFGVEMDSMFQKQSLMCARILLDTRKQNNINTAWAILYNLAHSNPTRNPEKAAWMHAVRMFNTFLSGIDRQNLHFVPFYSKEYFRDILKLYYERMTLYQRDYDKLLAASTSLTDYLQNAEELITIHATTSVSEAKSSVDSAVIALDRSRATYSRLVLEYEIASSKVNQTGSAIANQQSRKRSVLAAFLKLIKFIGNMFAKTNQATQKQIEAKIAEQELKNELNTKFTNLGQSLYVTAQTVELLNRFLVVADELTKELQNDESTCDFAQFMDDIETTAQMKANTVHWMNLKNNVEAMMTDFKVRNVKGSGDYLTAVLDWCNWGEMLTKSAVEHSELLRDAINKRYALISKWKQTERYHNQLSGLKNKTVSRQQTTAAMAEQLVDVRTDINNLLFSFCQAYFYENMKVCKKEYTPSFGGSLSSLLKKINAALMDSFLSSSPPSTVNRFIVISDRVNSSVCVDSTQCPIHRFRKTGLLTYKVSTNHPNLADLATYRVRKIFLEFIGARKNKTTNKEAMKVRIESSGYFQGKEKDKVYNFLTRPLSLTYEYGVISKHISIHADVYAPYRSIIQHITPYTTWIIRQSEYTRDIDLTGLTELRIQFEGSAINAEMRKMLRERDGVKPRQTSSKTIPALDSVQSYTELLKLEYFRNRNRKDGLMALLGFNVQQLSERPQVTERFASSNGKYYSV